MISAPPSLPPSLPSFLSPPLFLAALIHSVTPQIELYYCNRTVRSLDRRLDAPEALGRLKGRPAVSQTLEETAGSTTGKTMH